LVKNPEEPVAKMKKFLALALLITASASPAFADTLATWTFESSGLGSSTPTELPGAGTSTTNFLAEGGLQAGTAIATGFHTGAATYTSPAGNGSTKSLSSQTWAVGDYYQFQLNTLGESGLSLSYDQTGSGTGPRDFQLSYSLDGSSFTSIGSTYAILLNGAPNSAWNGTTAQPVFTLSYDLGSVTAINNASAVYFRVTDMSTTAINGTTVGSGGTSRIDNFSLFTTPVPEPSSFAIGLIGLGAFAAWKRKK
jgi:hypothetical protein